MKTKYLISVGTVTQTIPQKMETEFLVELELEAIGAGYTFTYKNVVYQVVGIGIDVSADGVITYPVTVVKVGVITQKLEKV